MYVGKKIISNFGGTVYPFRVKTDVTFIDSESKVPGILKTVR